MAHFKMLVIGDNVEAQLEPYSEHIDVEPYKDTDWDYEAELKAGLEHLKNRNVTTVDPNDPKAVLDWWYGGDIRWNDDKTRLERWTTYNPDSQWDYWLIGGRYAGTFIIKPDADPADYTPADFTDRGADDEQDLDALAPGRILADQARKRAIDFDAMRARAIKKAEQQWAEYQKVTEGLTVPKHSFAQLREMHSLVRARYIYQSHPWVQATMRLAGPGAYDYYEVGTENPKETFIKKLEMFAMGGYYGILQNNEWEDRDATYYDTADIQWWEKVLKHIDSLPGDTLLTVVDCHI